MPNTSTTDFEEFLTHIEFWIGGDDEVESAYALLGAIAEREGGEAPFTVTSDGDRTFVRFEDSPDAVTLVLASEKARQAFCRLFEERFLEGDADSHIGFMRNMANPKA